MKLSDKNETLALSCGAARWVPRDGHYHYTLTAAQLQHLILTAKNYGWLERDRWYDEDKQ
jgi:hypothetical protein